MLLFRVVRVPCRAQLCKDLIRYTDPYVEGSLCSRPIAFSTNREGERGEMELKNSTEMSEIAVLAAYSAAGAKGAGNNGEMKLGTQLLSLNRCDFLVSKLQFTLTLLVEICFWGKG